MHYTAASFQFRAFLAGILLLCGTLTAHAAGIFRVDAASMAATPDGQSWETAYKTLQSGTDAAGTVGGGEVWVKAGTYTAATTPVLTMRGNVAIYGGFAGGETVRDQRDWTANVTNISGENVRGCVTGADNAVIDGFTLMYGYASYGGGMHNDQSSPTVSHCIFMLNRAGVKGGGLYNDNSSSTVTDCVFTQNSASSGNGGGMANSAGSPTVTNCTFSQNTVRYSGAGMYNSSSAATVVNCVFAQNAAGEDGGGMYNSYSTPQTVTNCTFTKNSAARYGGGVCNISNSRPTIANSILWGDMAPTGPEVYSDTNAIPTVTYSCIQGGHVGTRNIAADPLFLAAPGDVRPMAGSPCIDTGRAADAPTEDIRGVLRPQGGGTDMGAYEYCLLMPPNVTSASPLTSNTRPTWTWTSGDSAGAGYYRCGFVDGVWDLISDAAATSFTPAAPLAYGSHTLYVQERDSSGNWGGSGAHSVRIDPVAISGTLDINLGAALTQYRGVNLGLTAIDGNGSVVAGMRLSNDNTVWTDWEPFGLSKPWTLSAGDGPKTVYVQFRNAAGVVSVDSVSDDIYLDTILLPDVITVDARSTAAAPDGRHWSTAYTTLQAAMSGASATHSREIWVKAGIYTGTGTGMGAYVFGLPSNFSVYGGFAGTENARDQRDWTANPTIVDGENSRGCVSCAGTGRLDGFTLMRGSGNGGMHIYAGSPVVANCAFLENSGYLGGGMYNSGYGSPVLTNCVFVGNTARRGGGMYNDFASPVVTNCTFVQNNATEAGGAICNMSLAPVLTNCILWGDTAPVDAEVHNDNSALPTVSWSCVQGGYSGTGNIDADPLFLGAPHDLHLKEGSPCVDTGTNTGAPTTDIRGRPRPVGAGIDMGVYEGAVPAGDTVTLTLGISPASGGGNTYPEPGTHQYARGERAILAAFPNGMRFSNWSGDIAASTPTGTIVMDTDKTATAAFAENIVYVDAANTEGPWDGRSWASAFGDIQSGADLAHADNGGEVWVRAGAYTSTKDYVLVMRSGVVVYGGFTGSETVFDQRNVAANTTSIDGQNARRCLSGSSNATVDGFTVTRGNGGTASGGAMNNDYYCSSVVANCIFADNTAEDGAGVTNNSASLTARNCLFTRNVSSFDGGAIDNFGSSTTLINCVLAGNSAVNAGAAVYNASGDLSMWNCSFASNSTTKGGGAIYNEYSSMVMTNCILWDSMYNKGTSNTFVVNWSCVSGGYAGTGNIGTDPRFISPPNNLRLQGSSPCIDAGTASGAPVTDILGAARPMGAGVDMGAYESARSNSPLVTSTAAVTNDSTPTWTWTSGGGAGTGFFRCGYADGVWDLVADATVTSFTPGSPLTEGPQTLYVQERDSTGTWGPSGSYTVTVDLTPPTGSLVIDDGAAQTDTTYVVLSPMATDGTGTGVEQARFSNDGATWGAWEPFTTRKVWFLSDGGGVKTVYAQYQDRAGNVSTDTISGNIILVTLPPPAGVRCVDAASTAVAPDGLSWATAFPTLQGGTNAASATGGEVWVRAGIYTATAGTVLSLRPGVDLYGGFAGFESARDERDWAANATVIDGEDTRRCVTGTSNATLDGFTIQRGYAGEGAGLYNYAASSIGTYSTAGTSVRNCIFADNYGGAVYNGTSARGDGCTASASVDLSISNCYFSGNWAPGTGSAILNVAVAESPYDKVQFAYGHATATSGLLLSRCVFVGARRSDIYSRASAYTEYHGTAFATARPSMVHCTFYNTAMESVCTESNLYGGGTTSSQASPAINLSILWGETTVSSTGAGCTPQISDSWMATFPDPLFVNPPDDLHLRSGSPCIRPGVDDDLGAYEYDPSYSGLKAPTVTSAYATTGNTRPTWTWTSGGGLGAGYYRAGYADGVWALVNDAPVASFTPIGPLALGAHTLYVQERSSAGQWGPSGSFTVTVVPDTTSPTGTIAINGGASKAFAPTVTLALTASDGSGSGVADMQFSNDTIVWSDWETFATSRAWTLPGGDGLKTVYARYRDAMGNVSASTISDSITLTLDVIPPTGTILIDGGAEFAPAPGVTLTLSASDGTGSGVTSMQFSNDGSTWSDWEAYAAAKAWTLTADDGPKTVYVHYRDAVGNVSADPISDGIDLWVEHTPPTGTVIINGGADTTSSRIVALTLAASDGTGSGVSAMQFSNDGALWSDWEPYAPSKGWDLPPEPGPRTVYVHFRDAAGNVSADPISDDITLVPAALLPVGTILINAGAANSNVVNVALALTATDHNGLPVADMQFSNDGSDWGAWEPFAAAKSWNLPAGDGIKTVYARYRDFSGSVSEPCSDQIMLDSTAPTGGLLIDNGAAMTDNLTVTLSLAWDDGAGSGVTSMRFSDDGTTWGAWETATATRPYTLAGGEGSKTVHAQFSDQTGNESAAVTAEIYLDITAPWGNLTIDGGAAFTNNPVVNLGINAFDGAGSGVSEMRFSSDDSTWTDWEPVAAAKAWTLSGGDGMHTVYAQFRDLLGNASSAPITATVYLDGTPPTCQLRIFGGAAWVSNPNIRLGISAGDGAGSGPDQMRFSDDCTNWRAWEPIVPSYSYALSGADGVKTIFMEVMDAMGNVSVPASASIRLERYFPTATIALTTPSPTASNTVEFAVNFSEEVGASFDGTDVIVTGSLGGKAMVVGMDPYHIVTVLLTDPNADGTVGISIAPGTVTDAAGNPYAGGESALCDIHNWPGFPATLPQTLRLYVGDDYTLDAQVDEGGVQTSYQWKRGDARKSVVDGPATPQWPLAGVGAADADNYWCEVSFDGEMHASDTVVVQVRAHLEITAPPVGGSAAPGDTYSFSVTAAGGYGPLSYQWRKDGQSIAEANNNEYVLSGLTAQNAGRYSVEVSDTNADTIESAPVTLTVSTGLPALGMGGLALLAAALAVAIRRRR